MFNYIEYIADEFGFEFEIGTDLLLRDHKKSSSVQEIYVRDIGVYITRNTGQNRPD